MISSEVQRTLVKSPPELWAELSDPASLARHLGELGEIRITHVEPEKTVEWEAADTTGKVLLKASGWGTKVTLTVARELAAVEPPAETELEPAVQAESAHAVEPTVGEGPATGEEPAAGELEEARAGEGPAAEEPAAESSGGLAAEAEPMVGEVKEPAAESSGGLAAEAEPMVGEEPEPERRRGFFARIFRRRQEQVVSEPQALEPELAVESEAARAEEDPPQDEPPDIAAELQAAEEAAAEQVATEEVTAVLTAALDRLGAAHHRPFSRA
jgi:hypothetical protein